MKTMEPKKAKTAILITVITAALILAVCLCSIFNVPVLGIFGTKEVPAPEKTPIVIVNTVPVTKPAPTSAPTPVPTLAPKPSEADLEGTNEMLQHPDPKNYLEEYLPMVTRTDSANVNGRVYMTLFTHAPEWPYQIVEKLDGNQKVTAIAQQDGYTLVLLKEGVAGWILSNDLDIYTE